MNPTANSTHQTLQIPNFTRFLEKKHDDEGSRDRFLTQFSCGKYSGSSLVWKLCLMRSEMNPDDLFALAELDLAVPFAKDKVSAKFSLKLLAGTKVLEPINSSSGIGTMSMSRFSLDDAKKAAAKNKGRLTLHLDLEVMDLTALPRIVSPKAMYGNKMTADVVSAFTSSIATDLTLTCPQTKGSQVKVTRFAHKTVLMSRSPVIAALLGSSSNAIDFPELSEKGLDLILWYFYTDTLKVDWIANFEELVGFMAKYELKDLREFLDKNLINECTRENYTVLYFLAIIHGLNQAKYDIRNFSV